MNDAPKFKEARQEGKPPALDVSGCQDRRDQTPGSPLLLPSSSWLPWPSPERADPTVLLGQKSTATPWPSVTEILAAHTL